MLERLRSIAARYDELNEELMKPKVLSDRNRLRELSRERNTLEEIITVYRRYEHTAEELTSCKEMLEGHPDAELKEMIHQEIADLEEKLAETESELKVLLLPKDPNDDRDVILEIRSGIGGDEAALFGADLMRMYLRYAERHGYKVETLSESLTDMGGVKEVILSLGGKHGAYSRLKYESGVHRVQRVPETESQGRIHTSAATVAVLPDAEDVQIEINDSEIRIDTYRSGGAGGQHVNKTSSAIRITHLPTGIVVQCQDERSQLKNKERAMRVLKSRLYDCFQSQQDQQLASSRKSMVGSGDRSERIRTYNFPQDRITDHRIGLTLYKLSQFVDGDMDEMIDALTVADRARMLSGEEGL